MLHVELHAHISAPREEIFDLLTDLGVRPAWNDHYQRNYRLAHPQSKGVGAAARYRMPARMWRVWVGTTIAEAEAPRRIVERVHAGRAGRSEGGIVWELEPVGRNLTRVDLAIWLEPGTPRERSKARLGFRWWLKRKAKRSLDRLRTILEEHPDRPLERASVAGFEQLKAPRFGMHPQRAASGDRG